MRSDKELESILQDAKDSYKHRMSSLRSSVKSNHYDTTSNNLFDTIRPDNLTDRYIPISAYQRTADKLTYLPKSSRSRDISPATSLSKESSKDVFQLQTLLEVEKKQRVEDLKRSNYICEDYDLKLKTQSEETKEFIKQSQVEILKLKNALEMTETEELQKLQEIEYLRKRVHDDQRNIMDLEDKLKISAKDSADAGLRADK